MAQKTKYDPLEAAKVTDKTAAQDEATVARSDWDTTPAPPAPPVAAPVPALTAARAAVPKVPKVMFEVVESRLVSVGASGMHRFKVGDRLDPVGYGGEEKLQKLGLNLRRIEE